MSLLQEISEKHVYVAMGCLEELLAPVGHGEIEVPAQHKRTAQSVIKLLEAWVERLEREMDTLHSRQEDVEGKLFGIEQAA